MLQARLLGLELLAAEAGVALAGLWAQLLPAGTPGGSGRHAARLLRQLMPFVMAHGGLKLQAVAQAAAARQLLVGATGAAQLAPVYEEAAGLLAHVAEAALVMEWWEEAGGSYSLLAHLHHAMGREVERNEAAAAALAATDRAAAVMQARETGEMSCGW